ncbi:unnamed protein product, partial [Acidithrix sp. C25]
VNNLALAMAVGSMVRPSISDGSWLNGPTFNKRWQLAQWSDLQ